MEMVFKIEKKNSEEAKRILLADDIVSRGSVQFKEASTLGMKRDVYYCYIAGTDAVCNKAKELTKDIVKLVEGKEKDEVIAKIKAEEEKAAEGFGAIFG